jgi:DNA replication protein DnaC
MMTLSDLFCHFRFLSDPHRLKEEEQTWLHTFLTEEYRARETKRITYLMKRSGIKRIKGFEEFDWTFNPKIPREKIMEFTRTQWLKKPCNLILIGPAGVGKTHIATALCHEAILNGHQTVFLSLFDFTAKLEKAKNAYTFIDYYAKVPILCLDELGYILPTQKQADHIFQIISKRSEVATTIVTSNLVPSKWGKLFDTGTASAILDRLSMEGTFITFEGRSYRSRKP